MDTRQFDELVSRLAMLPSRRAALKGLSGGVLAAAGLTEITAASRKDKNKNKNKNKNKDKSTKKGKKNKDRHKSDGSVGVEACIPTGKRCPSPKPRGKSGAKLRCKQCCQRKSVRGPRGKRKCACRILGDSCTADTAFLCCSGICNGGSCQETAATTTQPTTLSPTTARPTTIAPTTSEEPTTTLVPTTEEPTTTLPATTEEPTTTLPATTEEPTTTLPATTEEPTTTQL